MTVLLATGLVLYGYVVLRFCMVAVERQALVHTVLRSPFRLLMNALGALASPALVVAPFALLSGSVLAVVGLFARGPWRVVAVAGLVVLIPLLAVYARFGAPTLLDDD